MVLAHFYLLPPPLPPPLILPPTSTGSEVCCSESHSTSHTTGTSDPHFRLRPSISYHLQLSTSKQQNKTKMIETDQRGGRKVGKELAFILREALLVYTSL